MQADLIRENTIKYVTATALSAGDIVVIGEVLAIAQADVEAGASCALALDGIWNVDKLPADVVAAGVSLYWDVADQELQLDATGNIYFGKSVEAAAASTTKVKVLKVNV